MRIIPKFPRTRGAKKIETTQFKEVPSIRHGYCKSFDDTQIFYSIEGQGPPLVFCYGLVCSSLHWTYQIDYFRNRYSTLWFDYRGHHNTEAPKDPESLTLSNIARDLGAVLDQNDIRDAIFLGHSMGVNIVLEFYRQQPQRFAGMVLANGTARRPLETLFHTNATQRVFGWLQWLNTLAPEVIQKIWDFQKNNAVTEFVVGNAGFNTSLTSRGDIQKYVEQVFSLNPSVLLNLIQNYDTYDATSWLHQIHVPTLIIGGDQDVMTPLSEQQLMHQLIPNSQLEVVQKGSHCSQMDIPDLVNVRIERFLNEIGYFQKPAKEDADASLRPNVPS